MIRARLYGSSSIFITRVCGCCGNQFKSHMMTNQVFRECCNRSCAGALAAKRAWANNYEYLRQSRKGCFKSGKAHPRYIDGRGGYDLRSLKPEHVKWSRRVRRRDSFICRICFAVDRIVAHHVLPYAEFEEERFRVSNGMALCLCCHQRVHWKIRYAENRGLVVSDYFNAIELVRKDVAVLLAAKQA